jgi:hypothetical protein
MADHSQPQQAPAFGPGQWLNTEHPLQMDNLRGLVVLVDIWDYTGINCLRTLPYIQEWYHRYADHGLVVIGVHAPAFEFGRERAQVLAALHELDIHYPVLLDNDFMTWHAFNNYFWPSRYLIDANGRIRHHQSGEGGYMELEHSIQTLLREINPDVDLPPVMEPLRPEDYPERLHYRPTPELRGGLQRGALGNPEGYAGGVPILYSLPRQRQHGAFYVSGAWLADMQHIAYQGSNAGLIHVPYEAAEVNAVLSPHADTVERMLNPRAVSVEVWQDDRPIHAERRGADLTEDGRLVVHRPRMYNLIRNPGHERHELTLRVNTSGFALYAFSFISTVRD